MVQADPASGETFDRASAFEPERVRGHRYFFRPELFMEAFFISTGIVALAEMGDKTQLATIALAAKYQTILPVWLGTTAGMMIADGIGIVFGIVLGHKIPERTMKWVAALLFIGFGIAGLHENVPVDFWTLPIVLAGTAALLGCMWLAARNATPSAAEQTCPVDPSLTQPEKHKN